MIFNFLLLILLSSPAFAALNTVATTPDVAWLLHRVGGKNVSVKTLARAGDNYHVLDARPDFILAVSRADILCRVGAELEVGWVPKIVEKAANSAVAPGGAGDCDLSRAVDLDKPARVDRSMGDVHPSGNPHFWISPVEMAKAAGEVEKRLSAVDPSHAKEYGDNLKALLLDLRTLNEELRGKLKPLAGKKVYEYHKYFAYFFRDYGFDSQGSIEEIPGVSPSAARLGAVALAAKKSGAWGAVAAAQDPKATWVKFAEISGLPVATVPTSLQNPENPDAYRAWQLSLAAALLGINK